MSGEGGQDDRIAALLSDTSDEERHFVGLYAAQPGPQSVMMRLLTYSAVFLPGVVIGVYGMVVQSFQAVTIAFLILVANLVWTMAGICGEQRSMVLTYQVFRRLHALLEAKRAAPREAE